MSKDGQRGHSHDSLDPNNRPIVLGRCRFHVCVTVSTTSYCRKASSDFLVHPYYIIYIHVFDALQENSHPNSTLFPQMEHIGPRTRALAHRPKALQSCGSCEAPCTAGRPKRGVTKGVTEFDRSLWDGTRPRLDE